MINDFPKPPKALLAELSRDLKPVRPSPLPFRLALWATPPAVLIFSLILVRTGLRFDAPSLGPLLTWGVSVLEFALAIILVWMAARESTPARRLPKSQIYLALGVAACLVIVSSFWAFQLTSFRPFIRSPWLAGFACGGRATVAGIILVVLFARLFRNSLAASPAVAGAIYGAAAGLAVNSAWRLSCPVSTPSHSLGAHGSAVIVTALLGSLVAYLMSRWHSTRTS